MERGALLHTQGGRPAVFRDSDLVIVVPTVRPHRIADTLRSAKRATPNARVLFVCDHADAETQEAVERCGGEMLLHDGNWATKINAGINASAEALIFTGADDLDFRPGWLEAAVDKLTPGIGVVGTNDLGNPKVMAGEHATHFLVTRSYAELGTADEHGKLLHEGYPHEYVDDELVATAKVRQAWAMALDSEVEHLHPAWGKAETDPIYDKIRERMTAGRRIFLKRRRLWA